MKLTRTAFALSVVLAALATPAQSQVKIGVIASATGPTAVVGLPQRNTVPLLPTKVGDLTVEYVSMDDASDPNQTVTLFKKMISEDKIDALIGPTGSPNAMGLIQFAADSGTPVLAPVGAASVVLPMTEQKKWIFKTTQNDDIIAQALVKHMVDNGVKTAGFLGFNDAYGESWLSVFKELADANNIKIVATERYVRSDTSVTGQALKIYAAKPDVVLVAGTGAAAVLPQVTLVKQGYKGQIYQTHGAALPAFLSLGGEQVEGTILAASLMLVLPEIEDSNPAKPIAQDYIQRYTERYGQAPATFGANVYDAGLLLEKAIPEAASKAKPGTPEFRSALRDALEQTRDLVATQGVYTMSPEDHSGFDERGRELITVRNGQWHLLKP
ncbi:ABC transporter substrate-binding protein [Alcaligenes faecalis]|jgi:branched-chain amino acid transport system substrate-binding protein|uniref:ABC transporter substrate-binding protein n=1 Tax=Alcaligenes TaxID=507 RepID=UPI0005F99EB5|nr:MULTISPECIES: ABC transporter substrate-binding protein [Alcaligenes]ALO39714.1 branched-chain amino acid ABC transporter substrate-binding protein [Alcaligenes faecalis]KAA1286708.1 ABC transporter substrate-binding protein [Alcaligenes faecalis]MBH0311209.1 ABC transporter substrate-binding protein [Alcaligenes faecalis]MBQ0218259.1 ABC transporter substrate-binding protein [Alcaligenes faecalis]MBW4789424.1 ABC transporter substrate-binding protein [Alcaligenes faecalis subsp. faecalis]